MKICYLLATVGDWGGLEKHTFDVAGAMANRGHEVVVLCDPSYRRYCPEGVTIRGFDWSGSRRNPWVWFKLRKALEQLAPDIVHAQADKPAYMLSKSGCPRGTVTVGTVHNIKSHYRAYNNLKALIAVSGMIAKQLNHTAVTVVHNGVSFPQPDLNRVNELKTFLSDKPAPHFVAIGRLVEAKGFDVLLQAWPNSGRGTLVVLGDGKERENLERLCRERQLESVILKGHSTEVAEWLAASDFLVISSRNEGGPYVLSEALLSQLPVIGTRVGMVPDILPDSLVVEPGSVPALNALIETAINNPQKLKDQCAPAFVKANECLTYDAMMVATESVYLKAVNQV